MEKLGEKERFNRDLVEVDRYSPRERLKTCLVIGLLCGIPGAIVTGFAAHGIAFIFPEEPQQIIFRVSAMLVGGTGLGIPTAIYSYVISENM